ncbi:hypothetical protein JHK87_010105 [Glycine soja]|nr:hypothetical protein JHK87_010105 [Glycine soja]
MPTRKYLLKTPNRDILPEGRTNPNYNYKTETEDVESYEAQGQKTLKSLRWRHFESYDAQGKRILKCFEVKTFSSSKLAYTVKVYKFKRNEKEQKALEFGVLAMISGCCENDNYMDALQFFSQKEYAIIWGVVLATCRLHKKFIKIMASKSKTYQDTADTTDTRRGAKSALVSMVATKATSQQTRQT